MSLIGGGGVTTTTFDGGLDALSQPQISTRKGRGDDDVPPRPVAVLMGAKADRARKCCVRHSII